MEYSGFRKMLVGFIIFSGLFISSADARRLEDVEFLPEYQLDDARVMFQGAGIIKHLFFTVNAGAFYLQEDDEGKDPLSDIPKRLEFEYFYNIEAKDFVKLTNKWIAENTDAETLKKLRSQIDRFNELYQDVRPGDRYVLSYLPGKGTELSLNGESLGMVEGADFARTLFAIWLGPKPVSKSLKVALLKDEF